jgi:cytochrome c-type biogenesis protein CcmF
MAVVPFLAWSKTNAEKFLWKILTPWFCALAGGFLLVYFVLTEASRGLVPPPEGELRLPGVAPALGFEPDTPRMLVVAIGTLGLFAAVANIMLAVKVLRAKSVTAGGWLSHVGIGLLFLGTIVSNVYEKTENFALLEGDPPVVTPFGYTIGFKGWTHDDKTSRLASISDPAEAAKLQEEIRADWFKFEHGVKMEMTPIVRGSGVARADEPVHSPDDGHGHAPGDGHDHEEAPKPIPAGPPFIAKAPVFNSQQLLTSQSETQTMRWPYIHKELFRDVYLAIANDPKLLRARATLKPGEEQPVIIEELGVDTGYRLKYREFFMQGHGGESGSVMGGKMLLTAPDKKTYRLSPAFELRADGGTSQAGTEIEGLPAGAAILDGGIDASTKQATVLFELPEFPARWFVPLQVTNKPMINLVWIGVILMGIGGILAMMRRSIEARKEALLVAAPSVGLAEDAPAQTVAGTNGKGAGNGAGAAAAARNRGRTKAGSRR